MKFSFIIPVYKKPLAQLRKAVESLLDMSYKNIEIIAVMDGPNQILESYLDDVAAKNAKVRRVSTDHGGAPKARNYGFTFATGDYICFWDADCYAVPEMARVWSLHFKDKPAPDFLYSGYKWTDPKIPGFESEPFNPWLLSKYNYISSMSPVRRDAVIEWDESLDGLQDWDYFRRLVKGGARGQYVPCGQNAVAAGWSTEFPDEGSISRVDKRQKGIDRINAVRKKHGDTAPDLLVYGSIMKQDAVNIAQILEADYFNSPFWITREYKACLIVGFNPHEMDSAMSFVEAAGEKATKAIYWMGLDADMLAQGPYADVKKLAAHINKRIQVNFCPDVRTKNTLEDIGIHAEIISLPLARGSVLSYLPSKFRVMVFADEEYNRLADGLIRAMPDVEIDKYQDGKEYPYDKYSFVVFLVKDGRLITPAKNMLIHGRHMISNAKDTFAGYIDPAQVTAFKNEAIARIRAAHANPAELNKEAQDYYLDLMSPAKFKAELMEKLNLPLLEVVNA